MKSSPPEREERFAGFVRRALAAIRVEVPWAYTSVARSLGSLSALVIVDGEPARITAGSGDNIDVRDEARESEALESDVRCVTTGPVILDLLAGRDTLLGAVESDRIALFGGADALVAWLDVLGAFLHGAVRARASSDLLQDFRRRTTNRQERV